MPLRSTPPLVCSRLSEGWYVGGGKLRKKDVEKKAFALFARLGYAKRKEGWYVKAQRHLVCEAKRKATWHAKREGWYCEAQKKKGT